MSKPVLVILVLVVLGAVYGYHSALQNENPNIVESRGVGSSAAEIKLGRAWRPSPIWLPAYLVCTVPHRKFTPPNPFGYTMDEIDIRGYGLENRDGIGWGFSASDKKVRYRVASLGVGAAMGLVVALIIVVAAGWVSLRRPKKEDDIDVKPKQPFTTWP